MSKKEFITVIKANQNLIYKICYSYCSNSEDRKDLEQEILMQLWNSFGKFDGRVKVSTWIYKVALNTAISFFRNSSKTNKKVVHLDSSIFSITNNDDDEQLNENINTLKKLIDKLNEFDKAVILLYLGNNKYSEISEILGISETNVATKISRIKTVLKEQFAKN
ncbi:MAG: sigma-70 family RNA polymerase sigma factor [Bacteroidales bacterium]|nr:sigma-70 family RNA polymerase sigma factor [Bacteroidales bacterium]